MVELIHIMMLKFSYDTSSKKIPLSFELKFLVTIILKLEEYIIVIILNHLNWLFEEYL